MIALAIAWPLVSQFWRGRGVGPREFIGAALEDGGTCSICRETIVRHDLVARADDGSIAHTGCRAVAGAQS